MEFALLTNGKNLSSTKYYLGKPIDARRIFSIDISDSSNFKNAADYLQYLHRESTIKYSFKFFWNRCEAIDLLNIAGMLILRTNIKSHKKDD